MTTLRILTPCGASWEEMRGGETSRHCDACHKSVHDVTHLGEREVQGYVRLRGGASTCVRMMVVGAALAACASPPVHRAAGPSPVEPSTSIADTGPAAALDAGDLASRDTDHDGVSDRDDACPNDPGSVAADPAKSGCPMINIISMGELTVLQHPHFAKSRTTIEAENMPMIDEVVLALKASPQITHVEVQGHASKDERDPQRLSERRALAVVAKITAAGIDPKRVTAKGYGATLPIDSNDTAVGRAQNRRVEFKLVEDASDACSVHDAGAP